MAEEAAAKKKKELLESQLTTVEEVTDEQADLIEKEQIDSKTQKEDEVDTSLQPAEKIDLRGIEEIKDHVKEENEGTRNLLHGFKQANVKIHLLSDSLEKIFDKQKYEGLFDVGVLSVYSANIIGGDKDINKIFKRKAIVHVESADFIVILDKKNRAVFREKIEEKRVLSGWTPLKEMPYEHHLSYEVGDLK